ncbi:hypothetical protein BDR26DRAFT_870985, partial [Obelidium mucronatum]
MGFFATVCKIVAAQTVLCEAQAYTPPAGSPNPNLNTFKGVGTYLRSFSDEDPSGRAIVQISFGIPLVWHMLGCYVACTVIPGVIALVFILRGKDGERKWIKGQINKNL